MAPLTITVAIIALLFTLISLAGEASTSTENTVIHIICSVIIWIPILFALHWALQG